MSMLNSKQFCLIGDVMTQMIQLPFGNLVNNLSAYLKQYWNEHIHITILYGQVEKPR